MNFSHRQWWASAALAVMAVAALLTGAALGQAYAAPLPPEPEKKEPEKKDPPKPADPKEIPGFPGLEELQRMIQQQLPNLPPDQQADLQKQLEEAFKRLQQMQQQFPNLPMQPGVPGKIRPIRAPSIVEGRFGAKITPVTETLEQQLDLPKGEGQVVGKIEKDSAAEKAGLKEHDIILELGGKKVPANAADFAKALEDIKPNTPVDAVVVRKGKKTDVKGVALPEAPEQPAIPGFKIRPGGIQIMPIQPGQPFPNIMPIPIQPGQPFPNIQPIPGGVFPGGANVTTIGMFKNGDETTITQTEGDLITRVTVKDADGKKELKEIAVTKDNKETKYESLDKVPEGHKERVKKLIEMAEGKGQFKFEIKPLQ